MNRLMTVFILACASLWSLGCLDSTPDLDTKGAGLIGFCPQPYATFETNIATTDCCGDGLCGAAETVWSCPSDCLQCGDGQCSPGENASNCSTDCGLCGNGVCAADEDPQSCAADCGFKTTVRVDRVRYCRSWPFCNSAHSLPEYSHWETVGVKRRHQKKTYIAKLSEPPRAQTRKLIFIAAGQQNSLDDDEASRLTGQAHDYKAGFVHKTKSAVVPLAEGLAHAISERAGWTSPETFVALALDSRFNFEFTTGQKNDIEEAFYRWLKTKFYASTIDVIYLAGHSRGGCLAARLGARFVAEFPGVPVIVHSFDGVCSQAGSPFANSEFGVTSTRMYNPVNGSYRAFATNLTARFANRTNLAFYNLISGAPVVFGARAFSHSLANETIYDSGGARPWLEQKWFDGGHAAMDDHSLQIDAIGHLIEHCAHFGC